MKRFTKPIIIFLLLGIITVTAFVALKKGDEPGSAVLQPISQHETPDVSVAPADTTRPTAQPEPGYEYSLPEQSSANHINAAVLSNDTKASSLDTAPTGQAKASSVRPVAFIDSPTAQAWAEDGITRADIATAQARLRDSGFPLRMQEDPSMIRQYLPRRDIPAVHVRGFDIAGMQERYVGASATSGIMVGRAGSELGSKKVQASSNGVPVGGCEWPWDQF